MESEANSLARFARIRIACDGRCGRDGALGIPRATRDLVSCSNGLIEYFEVRIALVSGIRDEKNLCLFGVAIGTVADEAEVQGAVSHARTYFFAWRRRIDC